MTRAQFTDRTNWLRCDECEGRSFSDPLKAYHYPECSRYKEWRFGKRRGGGRVVPPTSSTGGAGTVASGGDPAPVTAPTTSELLTDKIRDSVLEDLDREVNGDHPW